MNLNEVVYVGNVPKQATDTELADFFKDVGRVIKVSFVQENHHECRTKVGFVLFESEMQALKACSFDQTIFQWNWIIVKWLVNDESYCWAGHAIFVRNISSETNEVDLLEAFRRYGKIEVVLIPTRNFACIGFREKSAAVAAQGLNNTMLDKTNIMIQVSQQNMRARLEDLDCFNILQVYNELMDAKLKYDYNNDDDDDDDNRVYDPVTNRFYHKAKTGQPLKEDKEFTDEDDGADMLIPPPDSCQNKDDGAVSVGSPQQSPKPDVYDDVELVDSDVELVDSNVELVDVSDEEVVDDSDVELVDDSDAELVNDSDVELVNDSEMFSVGIRRREMKFGRSTLVSVSNSAVRVENIPREVFDEEIVRYFAEFGLITSFEIEQSSSCIFSKVYTIIYQQQSVAEKVLECFMRKCEFSWVSCTVFTMRPEDIVQEVSGKSVLVNYVSNSVVFEDVVDAFREVGQVVYLRKTASNTTPSVVLFRHRISLDRAREVTEIDGDKVRVVPFSLDTFQRFSLDNGKLKEASAPLSMRPLKDVRMTEIVMKEQQKQSKLMILKTVFNPNYRNPDTVCLSNEVVIYNCPVKTSLEDLQQHFISIAWVTFIRWEQSPYDTNTWKVYASFCSFIDAFNAVRMKGTLNNYPIFKHLASEKPKLDTPETVLVECQQDDISVTKMHNRLVGIGAITFVDKVDHKKFIVICRNSKTAKKIVHHKVLTKGSMKASLYRDVLNKQNAQDLPTPTSQRKRSPEQQQKQPRRRAKSSRWNLPIPMDDLIAMQQRIMNDEHEDHHSPSRDDRRHGPAGVSCDNERDSAIFRRSSPIYEPPAKVPPPVTKNVFIPRPPAPGTGLLGGPRLALSIPKITIYRIQPDALH